MSTVATLEAFANRLVQCGVRYRYQGRNIETGIDCWAIPVLGYARLGIALPDFVRELQTKHARRDVHELALEAYAKMFRALDASEDVRPGDIVKFYDVTAQMVHGALVINAMEAIHAVENERNPVAPCVVRLTLNRLRRIPDARAMRYTGEGAEVFGVDVLPKAKHMRPELMR
jgi:cell wall-associated NlpC family hydrolase